MKLDNRKPSGREKDEAAVQLLAQLREKLYCDNSSVARRAAFNLSWMQEDGLEILQEGLLHGRSHRTKSAAAYGLRNMHGRMKKLSIAVLHEGAKDSNGLVREVSLNAIDLLGKPRAERIKMGRKGGGKYRIREIHGNKRPFLRQPQDNHNRAFPSNRGTIKR